MGNYKKYMLECEEYVDRGIDSTDPEAWKPYTYYFDTEKEMIDFVKDKWGFLFKVVAAFKLNKLSDNIFRSDNLGTRTEMIRDGHKPIDFELCDYDEALAVWKPAI